MQFALDTICKLQNRVRVVALFDSRLNGFPVLQCAERAIPMHEAGRHSCLADTRIGTGYKETAEHDSARCTDEANCRSVASSRCVFTETRKRAVPGGTAGGRIARTSKPSCCRS